MIMTDETMPQTQVIRRNRIVTVPNNIIGLYVDSNPPTYPQMIAKVFELPDHRWLRVKLEYSDRDNDCFNTFFCLCDIFPANPENYSQDWQDFNCLDSGCLDQAIELATSQYPKYAKWHLVTSKGPDYYLSNIIGNVEDYDRSQNDIERDLFLNEARRWAFWEDATIDQLRDAKLLYERLPQVMAQFKADLEELGFTW